MSDGRGRAASLLKFGSAFLVTLWAGSLWTVCFMIAPTVFATLPERYLAGRLAARLFQLETWLGAILAVLLIVVLAARRFFATSKSTLWVILLTAGAPLVSQLILRPMMFRARAWHEWARFDLLHGISAALFFIACLSALALVWKLNRQEG